MRVRGLPESIETPQLTRSVIALFNDLLERPPATPIAMECIHRALRPRGRDTDPPRDIICCLNDFPLKEEILRKARASLNGHTVNLRVPEDLEHFCTNLNILLVDLPDWYSDVRPLPLRRAVSMEGIAEAGKVNFSIWHRRTHPSHSPPKATIILLIHCYTQQCTLDKKHLPLSNSHPDLLILDTIEST